MRLDIHYHSTHSDCSSLDVNIICSHVNKKKLPIFTGTDHGDARLCQALEEHCGGAKIIWGVEITAAEGDFLIYSMDADYIRGLTIYQDSVRSLRRDDETAVIWAHPRVPHRESIGWASPNQETELIDKVVGHIDGLELYNGVMLNLAATGVVQRTYFSNLVKIAEKYDLTLTGGSDAHEPTNFFTAWTEFPESVDTEAEFIAALKRGEVRPDYDHDFYKLDVP